MPVLGVVHSTKIGPNSPTITTVTDVGLNREYDNGAVDVAFSLPGVNTAVSYKVTSSNGQVATGASSPIRVQNLPTGINTTFTITGVNSITIEGPPSTTSTGVVVTTVPYKPTIGVATAGNGQAYVVFTVINSGGKQVISNLVTGSPSGTATDTGSPITIPSLNNGTPYAFTVVAINANGPSIASNSSNLVTPFVPDVVIPPPTVTYYCYSSDCFTSDGRNFAYIQAPIFTSVSSSNQSTNTPYVITDSLFRGTRVTYCNTVEATAAIGAQQAVCQAVYIPPAPPTPCDPSEYTTACGTYTAGAQVPGCSPTNADYGYTVTSTASKTRTIYDCNGIITSTTLIPCTTSTFTATTSNDPRCPGYNPPPVTVRSGQTSSSQTTQTVTSARPTGADPVIIQDGFGGFTSSVTNTDGSTTITFLDANQNPTANEPITMPNINLTFDFSNVDWSGLAFYDSGPMFTDAELAAIEATLAQPSTPAATTTTTDTTTSTSYCFVFGTKITMADGSFKNIENLKLGDELLTFNIPGLPSTDDPADWSPESKWSTNSTANFTKTTTKVSSIGTGTWYRHYLINGQYRVTGEHYVFVKRNDLYQFVQVGGLKVGDAFLTADKTEIEITNIELVQVIASTVALDVEDNDMYFADGILAHNLRAPQESYSGGGWAK